MAIYIVRVGIILNQNQFFWRCGSKATWDYHENIEIFAQLDVCKNKTKKQTCTTRCSTKNIAKNSHDTPTLSMNVF